MLKVKERTWEAKRQCHPPFCKIFCKMHLAKIISLMLEPTQQSFWAQICLRTFKGITYVKIAFQMIKHVLGFYTSIQSNKKTKKKLFNLLVHLIKLFAHELMLIVKVPKRSFFISRENRQTRDSQHGTIFLKIWHCHFPPWTADPAFFLAVFHCLFALLSHAYHQMVYEHTSVDISLIASEWATLAKRLLFVPGTDIVSTDTSMLLLHFVLQFYGLGLKITVLFSHHVGSQPSVLSLHTAWDCLQSGGCYLHQERY